MMRDQSPQGSRPAVPGGIGAPPALFAPPSTRPQGQVLRGRYGGPLRSAKGKIKGLWLHTVAGELAIKLPKYLRPMLVRDLVPGSWVQVWAEPADDRWQGLNLVPWPEAEVPPTLKVALAQPAPAAGEYSTSSAALAQGQEAPPTKIAKAARKKACIQVCRKGKCFKQGGQQILQALQSEVSTKAELRHVTVEGTGCMGACKQGPNVRVLPQKKMHSRVTPDRALSLLSHHP